MDIDSYHKLIIFMRLLFPLIACLLLLLPHSLSYNYLPPLCHQEERIALMQFKDSFITKNYLDCEYSITWNHPAEVASWRMDGNNTNCCVWDGVECNQDTGHVIALNLSSSCLYGSITSNSSLFRLHHLQNLTLAYNDFNHSQIPSEIGNLSSLTHLDLSNSHFLGQIPFEIQYLSKLSFLSVSQYSSYGYNHLHTTSLASLVQNLTNLEMLDLSSVNISSIVPESLANLSSLKFLTLDGCGLYGRFPTRVFQLPHLQSLSVSYNEDLTGHLPEFDTNSHLEELFLGITNFSGNLPASIGNLNSLTAFTIDSCNFSGAIPNSFSNLTQLTWLDLSQNSFNDLSWLTGASSNDILPQFEILQLAHLNLTKFPDILRNQSKLVKLNLEGNNLQGLIPKWMYNASKESLQWLHLSNNFLTGIENFPAIIPWPNLIYIDFKNNMMHGSLPIPPPFLTYYFISSNSFTGRISPFICNTSSLEVLDLSYNYLSGTINPCFGNLSSVLVLRSNNFGGTIPKTWAKGCYLRMLDLSQNQLQGHLPRSLSNCTELEYLHVGHNQINGTYPFWLGTLQQLKILVLHSNGFHGAIRSPKTNYTFPNLHIIDLSHNHLSGNLPAGYFAQWDAMKSVGVKNLYYLGSSVDYSITMSIKGVELEYKKIHNDLKVIDFSCNRFKGEIPKQVGNLEGLHVLNLSNNAFTGHIPLSFGNLTQLESLDLSQNKLFGEIPPELVQLNFLSMFNVSYNGLTGPIPQGKQFGTFQNTSFEDNRGLCGRPLSKICGDSDVSPPQPSTFEENQGPRFVFEFGWKVVAMGYGCGFVFGVVIRHIVTTRKQDWLIKIFGRKQHQTRISWVNRRK